MLFYNKVPVIRPLMVLIERGLNSEQVSLKRPISLKTAFWWSSFQVLLIVELYCINFFLKIREILLFSFDSLVLALMKVRNKEHLSWLNVKKQHVLWYVTFNVPFKYHILSTVSNYNKICMN